MTTRNRIRAAVASAAVVGLAAGCSPGAEVLIYAGQDYQPEVSDVVVAISSVTARTATQRRGSGVPTRPEASPA